MNRSPIVLVGSTFVIARSWPVSGGNEIKERAAKRMPTVYFGDQVKDRIRCYIGLLMLIVVPLRLRYWLIIHGWARW